MSRATLWAKAGVEEMYDQLLRGQDGSRDVIVDSHGREVGFLGIQHAIPGQDLKLTIDNDLQKAAELAMGDRTGAIVAMDPRNGDILALVSRPSFDPNAFAVKIERAEWNKLITDPDHPLMNKAIQAQLAPGSTFKILMSVAGLQEGVAQNLKVNCAGGWGPYGFYHHCDEKHGAVDIHNAIPYSCDTYYYQLGDKLGIDRIAKYATEFGYGQKTGIDLPGEQAGLMPSAHWLMKNYHRKWYPDETLDVSIGQGAVEATPLQLARIIGGIASGGHLVRPHVVSPDQLPADFRKDLLDNLPGSGDVNIPIDPENWETITDGMAEVTQPGLYHTAGGEHLEGIDFGGKTGTAQVMSHEALDKTAKGRNTNPNVWFVGVTPRRILNWWLRCSGRTATRAGLPHGSAPGWSQLTSKSSAAWLITSCQPRLRLQSKWARFGPLPTRPRMEKVRRRRSCTQASSWWDRMEPYSRKHRTANRQSL